MNEGVRAEIISDNSCRQNVSDPECKFNMYDLMLFIPMDHTPPMFVTIGA